MLCLVRKHGLLSCRAGLENRADILMLAVTASHLPAQLLTELSKDPLLSRVAADRAPCVCAAAAEALGVRVAEQQRFANASGTSHPHGDGHAEHHDKCRDEAQRAASTLLYLLSSRVDHFRGGCLKSANLRVHPATDRPKILLTGEIPRRTPRKGALVLQT